MFDLMQYALIFYDFQLILARMRVEEPGVGLNALLYFTSPYEEMRLKKR